MVEINCGDKSTREINRAIKQYIAEGETDILVRDTGARHNLGVAIVEPEIHITFDGSAGYYCAGMIDGPHIEVTGSAGWGLAESMMNGTVIVHGHAGNGAAASIRDGTVVVYGDAAARAGVSMKGGLLLIGGNCGYMAGFMAQKGTLIICGDAGDAFADSMYEAICFVGGDIAGLGNDTVVETPTSEEAAFLEETLAQYLPAEQVAALPAPADFQKVVSGRTLWNFDKRDWETWQEAF